MATVAIEKAYQLKAIGGQQVYDDLDRIAKKFKEIADIKKNLNIQSAGTGKDTEAYKQLTEQLKNVQKEYKSLQSEFQKLTIKVKELESLERREQVAAKQAAADKVSSAKAATEAAKQATEAAKQATQQSVAALNAERQAAAATQTQLRQLQLQRQQQRMQAPQALPGSYNDIAAQYKAALTNVKANVSLQDAVAVQQAQQHLMRLKTQLDAFNRSLTEDKVLIGEYTTGIMNAFKKMGLGTLITDQVNTAKSSLKVLNAEFSQMKQQLEAIRQTGVGNLQAVERMLVENRHAAMQLQADLHRVQTELRGVGGVGSQITRALSEEFKNLKQQFVGFVVGYLGFQQLMSSIHSSIRINYELSDSFSDIRNRVKGTEEEVQSLIDSLMKLDTRSGVMNLVDIGAIVAKKGVAKEEIAGVAKSIDDLFVALGKEMGDPKETISALVKLVTVYSEDKHVTADNINAIGGAIAKLTTSGVATGQFLIDFAERMAGVRGITGITIDKVLGLGAALQEIGQRTEVSSTALSQIIIKLFTDAQKYADITERSIDDYKSRLQNDVLGTFVEVAQKLKGNAEEMEAFFSNAVDMHLRGARAISVIGDIAGNVDYARKRMADATKAMNQHGIVAEMAATKQHNFAASIDRVKKAFELVYTTPAVSKSLEAFAKAVIVLIGALPTLIKLGGLMLAGWVAQNAQLVLLRGQLIAYTAATWAYNAALGVISIAQAAYATGLGVLTGATRIAAAATTLFNTVLAATPLGAAVLLIGGLAAAAGLLAAGVVYSTRALQGNTVALKENAREQQIRAEVSAKAALQIADTINKIKTLTAVLRDATAGEEMHRQALEDLIAIAPEYLNKLDLQNIKTKEGAQLIDKYVDSLKKKAQLEAAQSAQTELAQRDIKLKAIEYRLQQKRATGKTDIADLDDEEKSMLGAVSKTIPNIAALIGLRGGYYGKTLSGSTFADEALEGVRQAREELKKEMDATDKVVQDSYKATQKKTLQYGETFTNASQRKMVEAEIEQVKKLRENYEKGTKEYKQYSAELKALIKEWVMAGGRMPDTIEAEINRAKSNYKRSDTEQNKARYRNQIKDLRREMEHTLEVLGSDSKDYYYKGSRLDPFESESIKLLNAERDNKITALRTAYLEEEETRKYYNDRLINNERTFNEELQRIEEDAIRKKIAAIRGNNPAEQQARAKLNLELLESQKKYNTLYYKDDAETLKAGLTNKETAAKQYMDDVNDSAIATDGDKAYAKAVYYEKMTSYYTEYMTAMDALEKKYNEQSKKNAAERERTLEELEHKKNKTTYELNKEFVARQYRELEQDHNREGRKLIEKKIEDTRTIIADPNRSNASKKEGMEALGRASDLALLNLDDQYVQKELDRTNFLYDQKLLSAQEYEKKIDELNERLLNNAVRRVGLELEAERKKQEEVSALANGAIQVGETIAQSALQAATQRDAVEDRRRQRETDWNRRVLEAQTQSLREKETLERAMAIQQDQREREQAEKAKRRSIAAMGIEYAAAALKIVAANIWRPDGWAQIALQEGVLAATYAAKLAFAASVPAYGAGGEVPGDGGSFGGNSHAAGGTDFFFRGRRFNAEANELAIVNKRSAGSNQVLTFTGTPKQIASGLNAWGGGKDFAPGWQQPKIDTGIGWMADTAQVPQFIASYHMKRSGYTEPATSNGSGSSASSYNDGRFEAVHAEIMSLRDHVHTIQVGIDPHGLNSYNKEHYKSVKAGTL